MARGSTPCGARRQPPAARRGRRLRLDRLLELRGRGEARDLGRRDLDRLARLRVATLAGGALGDRELAEARQRDLVARAELVGDALERDVDGLLGLAAAEAGLLGYRLRQLVLVDGCHWGSSCRPAGTRRH